MTVYLSPLAGAGWQFFDNNGVPLAGGKLYTYLAGTTTAATTYTSIAETNANPNPIILDSTGRVSNEIWIVEGQAVKFILNDANNVLIWSKDNIEGINDFTQIYANLANTTDINKGDALIGFRQSNSIGAYSGAVGRTVHEKLQEIISAEDFGAVGDGVTSDSAAIQAAINAAYANGGGTVLLTKKYLIDTSITVKDYVTLQGELPVAGQLQPTIDYNSKTGGQLIINSAATIYTNNGSCICNTLVMRKGLNLPFANATAALAGVAAFAGTAFTIQGQDAYLYNLTIMGFNKAVYSNGYQRGRYEFIWADNTNGIEIINVTDLAYVENCHFWPLATTQQPYSVPSVLVRTGTAFRIADVNDWTKLTNCFCYGYAIGFEISNANSITMLGCGADYEPPLTSTNNPIGFNIINACAETALIGCQAAALGKAVVINSTSGDGVVNINDCRFWSNGTYDIQGITGRAVITGSSFRNTTTSIRFDDTFLGGTIVGNEFRLSTTPISLATTGTNPSYRTVLTGNHYTECLNKIGQYYNEYDANYEDFINQFNNTATGPATRYRQSRGTSLVPLASQNGDVTGRLFFEAAYAAQAYGTTAVISSDLVGVPSATNTPGRLIFSTTPTGAIVPTARALFTENGTFMPAADNAYSCGASGNRWSVVYAATGAINTSDETEKTKILELSDAEKQCAAELKTKIGKFKFKDAIVKKGDDARVHFGIGAQTVKSTFEKYNLVAEEYGVFCSDTFVNESGNEQTRLGVRYDELFAFILAAM